jgi:hypothetical protein
MIDLRILIAGAACLALIEGARAQSAPEELVKTRAAFGPRIWHMLRAKARRPPPHMGGAQYPRAQLDAVYRHVQNPRDCGRP